MDDDIVDALEVWLQSRLEQVHTQFPGRVEAFDAATRLARVKPLVRPRSLHADLFSIPPIDDVPVIFAGGAASSLVHRVEPGDMVLVLVSEVSLGNWLNGFGEVDAEDESRFTLADAIAIGGLWSRQTVPDHGAPDLDIGMLNATKCVLGLLKSKIVAHNEVTSLRAELEKLWEAVRHVRIDTASSFYALSAQANDFGVSSGALATAFSAHAAAFEAGSAADEQLLAGKAALGDILQ